ncbi:MAG: polyprenyl synthetase family protein [Leptonema illini]|uniref:Polyprenyl synthetase family protein n=1 Tax=Leptonema illini TaxID=183 RepID=A0A833GZ75_9LEPT|nr:MAG: polyprenyl synthetase family protein [Leptonema illini]
MTGKAGLPPREQSLFIELGKAFETFFLSYVSDILNRESVPELAAPALYSLKAGGKRVRPALVLLCADQTETAHPDVTPKGREALITAAAVECIHTYSLIHDDLPAMDDDDMRRGMPSCHRRYPEWAAVLAGDTLNTFAFRLLADAGGDIAAKLRILADAAGHAGMAAGQALDLSREKANFPAGEGSMSYGQPHFDGPRSVPPEFGKARLITSDFQKAMLDLFEPVSSLEAGRQLLAIHMQKTGALIRASCELGGICNQKESHAFSAFGVGLGLLFQITDDILDVTGDTHRLGKTAGKDERTGKLTFPSLIGLDRSQALAHSLAAQTSGEAASLPVSQAARDALVNLISYILNRDH